MFTARLSTVILSVVSCLVPPVGPRERVVLVEVADRILVLGVAPGRVNTLHTLDAGDIPRDPDGGRPLSGGKDFQTWLKQTLERRSR